MAAPPAPRAPRTPGTPSKKRASSAHPVDTPPGTCNESLPAWPRRPFRILLDFDPNAISYLNPTRFTQGGASHVAAPPGWVTNDATPNFASLDVDPRPEDFLVVAGARAPTTGTILLGMHHLMTLDLCLVIWLSDDPGDWALVTGIGVVLQIRAATSADTSPGQPFDGLGCVEFGPSSPHRVDVGKIVCDWCTPRPAWVIGSGDAPHRGLAWDQATMTRLLSARITQRTHMSHLTARGWLCPAMPMHVVAGFTPSFQPRGFGTGPISRRSQRFPAGGEPTASGPATSNRHGFCERAPSASNDRRNPRSRLDHGD